MHMQIDLDNLKCLSPGLHCLLQLLLGPPSQGPGVHVPPPTTITAVHYLLQKAPEKSADSRRMAKGIVPVAPTGTRGRRPSMEDTGITYKTCACSRRW